MRRVRDLQPYVGKEIEAKIIELDKNRNNVVLSRRAWLEQTQSEVRTTFLKKLQKGQVRKGVVSSIVNFGAFVDLGGVDGLVHVSELSWKHIDHPSEVVEVGQEVTVEVLDVDMDRERVSLSLKATQEDPWQQFARTHAIGQIVPGKVTKLVPFGAFVRVDDGIEGLVHISELAERHVEIPEQVVQVGDDIFVKVIDIDLERRRISLSLKQANEGTVAETWSTSTRRSTAWPRPTTTRATTSTPRASTRRPTSGSRASRSSVRSGRSSTPRPTTAGRRTRSRSRRPRRPTPRRAEPVLVQLGRAGSGSGDGRHARLRRGAAGAAGEAHRRLSLPAISWRVGHVSEVSQACQTSHKSKRNRTVRRVVRRLDLAALARRRGRRVHRRRGRRNLGAGALGRHHDRQRPDRSRRVAFAQRHRRIGLGEL